MKILVTGGTGYIGSHTVVELQKKGFDVVIVEFFGPGGMGPHYHNIDKLLVYFQEHEPERLDRAERMYDALRGIE